MEKDQSRSEADESRPSRRKIFMGVAGVVVAAVLASGCVGDQSKDGRGERPSQAANDTMPAPNPSISFTVGEFKYTFVATSAKLTQNYPDKTEDLPPPVSPERIYLVVDGQLINTRANRPAPLDIAADIGVSIPLDALTKAIPHTSGGGDTCDKLTFFTNFEPSFSVPDRRCLFMFYPTKIHQPEETIPAAGSVRATYYRRVPTNLPINQLRLVGFRDNDHSITSSYPIPWKSRPVSKKRASSGWKSG